MAASHAVSGLLMIGALAAFLAASRISEHAPSTQPEATEDVSFLPEQQPVMKAKLSLSSSSFASKTAASSASSSAAGASPSSPPAPGNFFKPGEWDYPDVDALQRQYKITVLKDDPPVLLFNDFLTQERIDAILHFAKPKFARSTSGIEREVSEYRTSSTAWMTPDVLGNDPVQWRLRDLEEEIARIVQLPLEHQEHFQVLEYQVGQYYKVHSDFIEEQRNQPCGIRVATFFLYLNDVDEGGGTRFVNLDLTVQPKKGSAILWYSALRNTTQMDARTDHEALPVTNGYKHGANKWIHINDFITPWKEGRTV